MTGVSAGQSLGRYKLIRLLGRGASGVVYRAHDPVLDRTVAVKVPRLDALDAEAVQGIAAEFRHEARIAGKFSHQNVVTVFDVGSDNGVDYIVMEFVPGRSLLDYFVAAGKLAVDEALYIGLKCCLALSHMHHHGVIHRDVKPGNVLYHAPGGTAKLMDFSVSHNIEHPPHHLTGSLGYMAPEHFDEKRPITFRTDLFAVGSSLYKLLSGRYPFDRTHTAYQVLHVEPPSLTSFRDDVPEAIEVAVQTAMAKADRDRFENAGVMARVMDGLLRRHYPGSRFIQRLDEHQFSGLSL